LVLVDKSILPVYPVSTVWSALCAEIFISSARQLIAVPSCSIEK
jgi:hypothetical protein